LSASVEATTYCGVCATPLRGPYCHACGQASTHAPRGFRDVLMGQTGKLFYTLRMLLLHPGELAREIDEGRDRRAVRPLTLLLNLMAFFFLVGGGAGGFSARAFLETGIERIPAIEAERGPPESPQRARFDERLERRFQSIYSLLVIVQALAYGVALGVVERRRRKPWLVHFGAAMHYMCFSALVAALVFGLGRLAAVDPAHEPWTAAVMYPPVIAYMTLMLHRAYDDALSVAFGKALMVLLFGYVVSMVLSLSALALALLTA
jgi:hypothetical protein